MPQSFSQIYIHLVFSTKNRKNFISESIAPDLYSYMATVFHDECHSTAKLIGGVEDHIHALFNLSRTWCVADVVKTVKVSTSKWMKKQDPMLRLFEWQTGYGAFSVSRSNIGAVEEYIRNQREHHRETKFQRRIPRTIEIPRRRVRRTIRVGLNYFAALRLQTRCYSYPGASFRAPPCPSPLTKLRRTFGAWRGEI